ncbi:hypothetical protein B046DRAFT_06947 [Streptomyces sp. LamerLS-316]|uniref:hypothetical protein n=1 Tax=unclassified Streptomyces TaxID=2593676 RepID=UPI000823DB57|nr:MULTISPECIES: hypothetical protein [unclassified Streptomyces]MYQ42590.1 hypothetical protein [Streptomyces sp. SID4921]SCK25421.1 hypothetical protein B046DRAFT_06947 [Streptomyces sp. LamerLS-316]
MFGMIVMGALFLLIALAIALAVLGVHALLLGRLPGHRLPRLVRQPRVWGAGALLMVVSWNQGSPTLLAIGIGLVALGHVMKPAR